MINKKLLFIAGIISLLYFSIPVLLTYGGTKLSNFQNDECKILVFLMILCPPSYVYFFSMNYWKLNPYSFLVQFGLFMIGWLILYLIGMIIVKGFLFLKSKKNKKNNIENPSEMQGTK